VVSVTVLVEFLERNRTQLLERIESGAAPNWDETEGTRHERLDTLVDELIAVLKHSGSRPHPAPYGSRSAIIQRDDRELIRSVVIEEAARHSPEVSVEDVVLLSDWAYVTERTQLRESYHRLSELLDDIDDCVGIVAPDGRIEYLNKGLALQLQHVTGVRREELLGKTLSELGLPPEHSLSRSPDELLALARHSTTDERLFHGRWKKTTLQAIQAPREGVTGISLSIRDIHDPRLAEIRLSLLSRLSALVGRVDSDDLADALASVPVPDLADWCIVNLVETGHIVRSAVSRGDPAKAAVREEIIKAFPDWEKNPLWEELRLTTGFQLLTDVGDDLRHRIALNEEQYRLMTQEGVRSIMVQPVVSRGQTAAIITLLFTAESGRRYTRDHPPLVEELALHAGHLIENARLLRELRTNEARFRVAIAGARTLVFEQDLTLRYLWYYNPVTAGNTFVGRTDEEMLSAEDAAALTHLKQRALRGESVREEVGVTVGGERRDYREVVEPMRDHSGNIFGIIGSATDITEEKRTKQRLQNSLAFREQMMGVLSHDLRNPLNAITLTVESLLQGGHHTAGDRRQMHIIQSATARMLEMIETLLDLIRVRSMGRLPIRRVPVDLGARARAVVDEISAARPGRAIELHAEGDLQGEWDPGRIEQALSNLICNGLQYGDQRTPVRVSLDGRKEVVELRVKNEGPAIPPDLIPALFEPFTRGTSDNAVHRGLGLGLYITGQIVRAHDGDIHVESTDQAGTQFSLFLPRGIEQAEPVETATTDSRIPTPQR
jgi:PAS domain S-box-containing protein